MLRRWASRYAVRPDDVFRRPAAWERIPAAEAANVRRWVPVVVVTQGASGEQAVWYDEYNTIAYSATGSLRPAARFYRYKGRTPVILGAARPGERAEARPAFEREEEVESSAAGGETTPAPRRSSAVEQAKDWVEITLVDENGDPVPGEAYRLELPDGSVREGALDAGGKARVEGIDPGACRVTFSNLDARDWDRA
jgi:hypothetical protein